MKRTPPAKRALVLALLTAGLGTVAYSLYAVSAPDVPSTEPPSREAAARAVPKQQGNLNPTFWNRAREDIRERLTARSKLDALDDADIARLEALGYLSGYRKGPRERNITIYDAAKASDGYNLYVTGLYPSADPVREIRLIDMTGQVVYRWQPPFPKQLMYINWRRVHLFEDGDLLIIVENAALVRLSRDSQVEWWYAGHPHHDLFVDEGGDIFVLTKRARRPAQDSQTVPLYDDAICVLSPEGQEKRCVSVLASIERSQYASVLERIRATEGDVLHSNSLEVLDGRLAGRSEAFKRGNVLVSVRDLNAVCVIDLEREEVVWMIADKWKYQHSPTVLDNGNLLVYDNNPTDEDVRTFIESQSSQPDPEHASPAAQPGAFSRVVEIDPFTGELAWEYKGDADYPFYSFILGHAQRLPNGNTLITESVAGRAFEVTREGEIVWEFISPDTAGENGELIATLLEMIRIPADFPLHWAGRS